MVGRCRDCGYAHGLEEVRLDIEDKRKQPPSSLLGPASH